MSSLQLLLDLAENLDSMSSPYYGSDFGLGLNPLVIQRSQRPSVFRLPLGLTSHMEDCPVLMRRSKVASQNSSAVSNVGKDGFQVCMDVQQFKPSELSVKVVDNAVVVEGKHEEREDDHGYISRHFVRRYAVPKDYDSEKVVSTLSSDGVLTISIPKPAIEEKPNEKIIQIQQTGPAHLNVKCNQQEKQTKNAEGEKAQN
ncbi:heat shock protein 23-like [Episyrphus balteatus]|uniref:heat shock protein 23-like n=1 Tax=Episyrphus balteatus TaxID=286459 RepID=UPI00248607A5|nr:heat shock protein 23-like [Episyrphus balteatus]